VRRVIVIAIIVLALGGTAAYVAYSNNQPAASSAPTPVARPAIADNVVTSDAEVKPLKSAELSLASTGPVAEVLVVEGDLVKKDQIMGYLQSHAEQVAQRDEIAARLEEAKLRLATETELDQARIDDATIKVVQNPG